MSRGFRFLAHALAALMLVLTLPVASDAQRRAVPRPHPAHPDRHVVVRGHVFIGGYFYDPVYGAYPWWPRTAYPYWYFPVYDYRADVHLKIEPKEAEQAAVYVDGFYAGVVDDFDGVFQSLPLPPGGHRIALYLEGYRTIRHNMYLRPGSSFTVRGVMEPLPEGVQSEPPDIAPPVPEPPSGTYRRPVNPPRVPPPAAGEDDVFGTLDLWVQPASAEVKIDGQPWVSSEKGHFVIEVPAGRHRVEVSKAGHKTFSGVVEVAEGKAVPLNVSLMTGP